MDPPFVAAHRRLDRPDAGPAGRRTGRAPDRPGPWAQTFGSVARETRRDTFVTASAAASTAFAAEDAACAALAAASAAEAATCSAEAAVETAALVAESATRRPAVDPTMDAG